MCPVTLQEMNGSHAFVVLMSTGWVMAEKATKEVGIAGLQVIVRCDLDRQLSPRILEWIPWHLCFGGQQPWLAQFFGSDMFACVLFGRGHGGGAG